ncbi:MAG: hypothetical protein JF599_10210 [Verrucomicrobia bacterium]|nr:hypothetical protein [Verrucomicrobiota bacterium]
MKIGWVMGWAVPEVWFSAQVRAAFPDAEHFFFAPTEAALTGLEQAGPLDCVAGYSLGAHCLLAEAGRVARLGARVTLLAPILAFPAEEALGGRVARTQVRYLARWLKRDRPAALADFYSRAGLDLTPEEAAELSMETLNAGLVRLEQGRVEPPVPDGWRLYLGDHDALLDATALARQLPGLVAVANGTHHPAALLRAWAEDGL